MSRRDGQLFDGYMAVDWSASGTPRTGADSIWISVTGWGGDDLLENPPTRRAATERIAGILESAQTAGRRLLCGFDFPFGYPEGTARRLTGEDAWWHLWARIAEMIEDRDDNSNNRFDVAAALNARFGLPGPFWGNGLKREIDGLPRTKPAVGWGAELPPNKRYAECHVRSAQEVWKLSGVGSVGGQALTGIAALEGLRHRCGAKVWPFETTGAGEVPVFAEIYPSLIDPVPDLEPKDAGQVLAVTRTLSRLDREGRLAGHLAAAGAMPSAVCHEEALILGMDDPHAFRSAAPVSRYEYERDPAAIYAQSFATIEAEAGLDALPEDIRPLAVRVIHACGMVDVAKELRFASDPVSAGRAALAQGAPILCDSEMVGRGIIARGLPTDTDVVVTLNAPSVPGLARALGTTRSAAAVDLWRDRIEGAVVAVGNAPTALFHLLERLEQGWPRPAVILGFPVGFVGAAESKAALASLPHGVPFVTLPGRRGGSAMAAAAVNALTLGLRGDGT